MNACTRLHLHIIDLHVSGQWSRVVYREKLILSSSQDPSCIRSRTYNAISYLCLWPAFGGSLQCEPSHTLEASDEDFIFGHCLGRHRYTTALTSQSPGTQHSRFHQHTPTLLLYIMENLVSYSCSLPPLIVSTLHVHYTPLCR